MNIHLFLLPYDSGKRGERMGAGPRYWLENGLVEFLQARGHSVFTKMIEVETAFPTEIQTSFDLYHQLATNIQQDCAEGGFPLVLSGNCGAAIGGITGLSGLIPRDLGVAWLDAHGDFNTPDTTSSGFLDGMGLATAAGLSWKNLTRTLPSFRPVKTGQILHIGGRDFDPLEELLMVEHNITRVDARNVRENGLQARLQPAIQTLEPLVKDLYLHFDVDVLDPVETPANHFPAPGGLFPDEVIETTGMLRDHFTIRGMGIASFDPRYDEKKKTLQAVFNIIAAVLGKASEKR